MVIFGAMHIHQVQLLRRVPGFTAPRAAAVVAYRDGGSSAGSFISRSEIADIKGIGSKTFQQAAG